MKQALLEFLAAYKHNYHSAVDLCLRFGNCRDAVYELVDEGLIVERPGVNQKLYKLKTV